MRRFIILGLGAAIAAAAVSASGCGGGGAKVSHGSTGDRISMHGWPDVVVVGLRRDVKRSELFNSSSSVESTDPDKEVIVVKARLINDEGVPMDISPFWMFALQSQGKDIKATAEIFADKVLDAQTLPPDKEVEGDLAYTIPRGLSKLALVYQPGAGAAVGEALKNLGNGSLRPAKEIDRAVIALEP